MFRQRILLTLGAGWIAACPGSLENPGRFIGDAGMMVTDTGTVALPDAGPDCDTIAQAYLSDTSPTGCARAGCHATMSPSADLDLESPDLAGRLQIASQTTTCNGLLFIDLANPRESLLYSKLTTVPPCGQRMPLGGTVPAQELECVGQWLDSLAAPPDAGVPDTGPADTGPEDTGPVDMGPPDMGPDQVSVQVEAEDGTVEAPLETRSSTAAQGGSFILSPAGLMTNADPMAAGAGKVQFTFSSGDTTVRVWLRALTFADNSDSFWVGIDGNFVRFNQVNNANYGVWFWDQVHDSDDMDNVAEFTLTAGQHTLEVVRREANARLDAVLITDDFNVDPNN